jgi:tRNA-modifying protein YgfZ
VVSPIIPWSRNPCSLIPGHLPDKPSLLEASTFTLPDHHVLALQGRDAVAFAQAQFMNDVAALQAGHWQWNGWLTPKGRVIALFALLRFDAERIWLLLQDADPTDFASRLQRFVFRSKVAIEVRGDLQASAAFLAPSQVAGNAFSVAANGDATLDFGGSGGERSLLVAADAGSRDDAEAVARWAGFDLAHGLPRLPASQQEQWTPQQLSLDRLQAYSVRKGCYPGQEIVARTHFLGQAKRGLALLESDAALAAGTPVVAGEQALGSIVSTASPRDRHLALAVLPLEPAASAPSADGHALRPLGLLEGLAR